MIAPQDALPDTVANARNVNVYQGGLTDAFLKGADANGMYIKSGDRPLDSNTPGIMLSQQPPQPINPIDNYTYAHELGHSIWYQGLDEKQQSAWNSLHTAVLGNINSIADSNKVKKTGEGALFSRGYRPDYTLDPSHTFAHNFGLYAQAPELLKKVSPDTYRFFQNLLQFEYSRKK